MSPSFFRGCYELIVGIVGRLGIAWNQGDFVTKSPLTFMIYNTVCTIPGAVRNAVWFVVQVWTAYNALRSWLRGSPKLEKGEKMNDSIESYEELTQVRRYREERLQDFVDRLVTKWKTLTPKISDARFLRVLKQHFPREFLQGLHDLNLDEVKVNTVIEKWNNFCKWTAPPANRAAPRATQPTAARVQPVRRDARQNPQQGQQQGQQQGRQDERRCYRCNQPGHLFAQCPLNAPGRYNRRAVQEVNVPEGYELTPAPYNAQWEQEGRCDREPPSPCAQCGERHWTSHCPSRQPSSSSHAEAEAPRQVFHDEGSDTEESTRRTESVSVFSIAKTGTPFIAKKIHITFQFTNRDKKVQPVKALVDTGSCANVVSFSALQKLGYAKTDLIHDAKVPSALAGFAGEDARTLGGIFLKVRLGSVTRDIPFIVMNDVLTHCIIGMPAIDAFDLHIRGRARAVSF